MSQEQEPYSVREVLVRHMLMSPLVEQSKIVTPLERDLLAWARAYGEQVREACIQHFSTWKNPPGVWLSGEMAAVQMAIDIRQLKLPEPT